MYLEEEEPIRGKFIIERPATNARRYEELPTDCLPHYVVIVNSQTLT